jgi:hypothetical protein
VYHLRVDTGLQSKGCPRMPRSCSRIGGGHGRGCDPRPDPRGVALAVRDLLDGVRVPSLDGLIRARVADAPARRLARRSTSWPTSFRPTAKAERAENWSGVLAIMDDVPRWRALVYLWYWFLDPGSAYSSVRSIAVAVRGRRWLLCSRGVDLGARHIAPQVSE